MTQIQESVAARNLVSSKRAFTAPFLAIMAGLVVLLMAIAATAFALAGWPADATAQTNTGTAAVDGYVSGLIAANTQQRLVGAQRLDDGWAAELVTQRTSTATDGWEAALIRPHQTAVDGYIQQFLSDR